MTDTPPREGSLEAPFRHPLAWRDDDFYDLGKVETEMERVFGICHGCRRCFNLCDSFPRLFDLIDSGPTGEIDGVDKADYAKVTEACTLCDMCFMTKCPYVPPHEWAVDFPHLLLRHRAARRRHEGAERVREQLGETDRNGALASAIAPLANWASRRGNALTRPLMERALGVDREALLPEYHARKATDLARSAPAPDPAGPAFGRKVVVYATCFAQYNEPSTALAALAVLARQGVDARLVYPVCCGMPQLEAGDIAEVAERARRVAGALLPFVDDGCEVVTLTASCGLMLKFEWPLVLPEDEDVRRLAGSTRDVCEYVVSLAKTCGGLAEGLSPLEGGVTVHGACHARAQNMGAKSAEMLRLIPSTRVDVVERCSGHGGTFGVMKKTHEVAVKVGRPAARQVVQKNNAALCSDCPLACRHLGELVSGAQEAGAAPPVLSHPIEALARAYGLA